MSRYTWKLWWIGAAPIQQSITVHDSAITHLILDGSEGKDPMLLGQASIQKRVLLPNEILIILFYSNQEIFFNLQKISNKLFILFLIPLMPGLYFWLEREHGGLFRYCGNPRDSLSSSSTSPFIWSNAVKAFSFMKFPRVKSRERWFTCNMY